MLLTPTVLEASGIDTYDVINGLRFDIHIDQLIPQSLIHYA